MHTSLLPLLAAGAAGAQAGPPAWLSYLPFVAMGLIFWFLILRPQMKQQKEQRAKLESIKKGDEVVTGGGVRGKVTKVSDDELEVEVAQGVRIRVVKGTLSQVLTKNAKPAND